MDPDEQKKAKCIIGTDYLRPSVQHEKQRLQAIEMFKNT
nr:hypothetical protein [Halalkalibacterium ligniniphilum]